MRVRILGVDIDAVTRKQALAAAAAYLDGDRGRLIFTPNPEMLVLASRDAAFKAVLNSADLAIPDGVGLLWAARRAGTPLPERVTGTDLMQDVCGLAAERQFRVFLLGGEYGEEAAAAAALRSRYAGLEVASAPGGAVSRVDGRWQCAPASVDGLKAFAPDVLFVAFGHGKQEKWLADNLSGLPSVRVAMGIGGAFNFLAGRSRRAPAWLRWAGLEWLWRLILEPRRWRRIWDAVVIFPFLLITDKN